MAMSEMLKVNTSMLLLDLGCEPFKAKMKRGKKK